MFLVWENGNIVFGVVICNIGVFKFKIVWLLILVIMLVVILVCFWVFWIIIMWLVFLIDVRIVLIFKGWIVCKFIILVEIFFFF